MESMVELHFRSIFAMNMCFAEDSRQDGTASLDRRSSLEGIFPCAIIVDEHLCKIQFLVQSLKDFAVNRVIAYQINVMTIVSLPDPMNPGFRLLEVCHAVIV